MRWDRFFGGTIAATLLVLACADGSRADTGTIVLTPPPADVHAKLKAATEAWRANQPSIAQQLDEDALAMPGISVRDKALALLNHGLAKEQTGDHAAAIADFTAALHLDTLAGDDRAHALFDRGVSFDQIGRMDDALADYSAAIAQSPHLASALNNRANIYRRLGRLAEAKADYEASIAAGNAQSEFCYYGLGQVAEAQGDPGTARDYYRRAVAANGEYRLAVQRLEALGDPWTAGAIVLHPPGSHEPVLQLTPPRPAPAHSVAHKAAPARVAVASLLRPAILGHSAAQLQVMQAAYHPAEASGAMVQLGAWRDQADAARGWNALVKKSGGALDGLAPRIVAADIPGRGRYYRLRTAATDPAALCAQLKTRNLACMKVRE